VNWQNSKFESKFFAMFLLKDMKDFVSATNLLLRGSEISFQGFRMIEDSWKANLKLGLNDWLYLLN